MKYKVLYRDTQIGVLMISEKGKYKYIPDENGVESVKDVVSLTSEMKNGYDWGDPIPFFKNRIENAKKFSQEDDVSTHTDLFRMVKELE